MRSREFTKELIGEIEREYDVVEWKHQDYHIWPVLRIRLYLLILSNLEKTRNSVKETKEKIGPLRKLCKAVSARYKVHQLSEGNIKNLYCGAPNYRVAYAEKKMNCFFDPLIDEDKNGSSLLLEYKSSSYKDLYKPSRIILLDDIHRYYKLFGGKYNYTQSQNIYVSKLKKILDDKGIEIPDIESELNQVVSYVDICVKIFLRVLKKIDPQKIIMLCYYSPSMLSLNIVSHKLGIPTVDMQHGPQGEFHLAYSSWSTRPKGGYEALPNEFYTWDRSSADNINDWASYSEKHNAVCVGNPWIERWKKGKFGSSNYIWPNNIILYTLQPVGDPLEDYLLRTINETKNEWNWWLRLHPRQSDELKEIKNKLNQAGLLQYVNISDATKLPLPEILLNSVVHITKFSGCAFEAYSFQVPTILIDHRGQEIYNNLLKSSDLFYHLKEKEPTELQVLIEQSKKTKSI